MASKDAPQRDTQALTDEPKAVPRDRDQSSISPERAHSKADKAEFPETGDALAPDLDDLLTARDNLEDEPEDETERDVAAPRRKS